MQSLLTAVAQVGPLHEPEEEGGLKRGDQRGIAFTIVPLATGATAIRDMIECPISDFTYSTESSDDGMMSTGNTFGMEACGRLKSTWPFLRVSSWQALRAC
jgi:hypothetical protein